MARVQFDRSLVQLATRIPRGLHRAVKLAALADEVTVREWVADALAVYLRRCRGTNANESGPGRAPVTATKRTRGAA